MNRIISLFGIKYPIVQAGMVWCSGWKLASAVSNAGGLGLLGAGSMTTAILQEHIIKCKKATSLPFGVNLPLLYPNIGDHIEIIIKEKVPIVFTSAGNPSTWTSKLKKYGIKVIHVVSSLKFALKAQEAGCDAIVAEGFEAGGHNGREETTTFCLVPLIAKELKIPVIAAGGIGNGPSVLAAFALGAEAVQVGSLFAVSSESSASIHFKERVIASKEGETKLLLKGLTPVRLLKNPFSEKIFQLEQEGAKTEELRIFLGKGRAKKGIFEGDLDEGELEIGQIAALINSIRPAGIILEELWDDYLKTKKKICMM